MGSMAEEVGKEQSLHSIGVSRHGCYLPVPAMWVYGKRAALDKAGMIV